MTKTFAIYQKEATVVADGDNISIVPSIAEESDESLGNLVIG